MKENHGLKCSNQQVLECLDVMTPTMNSNEVQMWLSNNRVIKSPIQGIPVLQGVGCSVCPYSAKKRTAIYNHISSTHRNQTSRVTIVQRNIQEPFQSHLHKYIQVEVMDESEVENGGVEDWESKLKEEFTQLLEGQDTAESRGRLDMRLINAFVAKIRYKLIYFVFIDIRWDVHLTGINTEGLAKLVQVPTIREPLHQLILCGRRYVKECCKKLSGGNMIVRRALMMAK